jgi:hypothetical protein
MRPGYVNGNSALPGRLSYHREGGEAVRQRHEGIERAIKKGSTSWLPFLQAWGGLNLGRFFGRLGIDHLT